MVNGYQIYLMRNYSTYHMFEKRMALVDGHPEVNSLTNCHSKYMLLTQFVLIQHIALVFHSCC